MAESLTLTDVLEKVDEESGPDEVSVRTVVESLQYRGYGPLLLIAGLISVLPTGAIPGVPTLTAILILFIATQMMFGKKYPWLPNIILDKSISREKFDSAQEKSKDYIAKVDHFVRPRATFMFNSVSIKLIALICCLLAITMPPLEVVPFLAFVPALAITILGLSVSARDGALAIFGLSIAAAGVYAAISALL